MKTSRSDDGTRLTIFLSGEIDHHTAAHIMREVMDKLEAELPRDCILDMSKVSFMDSSGIAIILKAYKLINSTGGRLAVSNVQAQPMRVLDASGLDRIIKILAPMSE
ncbi:MAG: STAS domain-containing protein [Oscillospiraceae bacterium]|nr:STAS domain-containing protein [Oscillospiraceae bacterium]MBR0062688.1 STAS domain-containing protein [Oscillospiraceae bacterium]